MFQGKRISGGEIHLSSGPSGSGKSGYFAPPGQLETIDVPLPADGVTLASATDASMSLPTLINIPCMIYYFAWVWYSNPSNLSPYDCSENIMVAPRMVKV